MTGVRKTKEPRPAAFRAGDVVRTVRTVKVVHQVGRRKWLRLLPGTAWTVLEVIGPYGAGRPRYRLKAGWFEIVRRESQLRPFPPR